MLNSSIKTAQYVHRCDQQYLQSQNHIFPSWPVGIFWNIKNTAANVVFQLWHKYKALAIYIVFQETPEPQVAGHDIWRTRRPCHWKIMADHPRVYEILSQQLLYKTIDQCEEVHHLAWKWYLQGNHSVEVMGLQNSSAYHGAVVL